MGINSEWTLFLDRDGVINRVAEGKYVKHIKEFKFIPYALKAISLLSKIFGRLIIVTNQRGIGRGLVALAAYEQINNYMLSEIEKNGGRIEAVYHCPHDYEVHRCNCRKPKTGMAKKAKGDNSAINFKKSIVVGDSNSDIEFGKKIGAITVVVGDNKSKKADFGFKNLYEFACNCN